MLLYKLLTSKDDIQAVDLIEEWPKNGEELGPYTRKISSVEEAALLAKSLNVIKAALDS